MVNTDILNYADQVDLTLQVMSDEAESVNKEVDPEQRMYLRLSYDRLAEASAMLHRAAGE